MIQIELIENISSELDENIKTEFYNDIEILLGAINDWDETYTTLEDFEIAWTNFLNGSLNHRSEVVSSILSLKNPQKDAWKMESISGLIRILKNDKRDMTLQEALDNIKINIRRLSRDTNN